MELLSSDGTSRDRFPSDAPSSCSGDAGFHVGPGSPAPPGEPPRLFPLGSPPPGPCTPRSGPPFRTDSSPAAKHLAETMNRSPCLGYRTEAYPVRLPDGRVVQHRTWGWRERACPLTDSGEHIEANMEHLGLQKKGYIGECPVTYFSMRDLLKAIFDSTYIENGDKGRLVEAYRCSLAS